MNGNFTPQARGDLLAIRDWIAADDDRAADRVVSRIVQTAMMFGQFPMLGRLASGVRQCLIWRAVTFVPNRFFACI
ncbi:MAG: type II toxin-antitoxin system RelE/ParE family toxin [Pseudomonadota bacterium]|uniref:type II toxin-antitoxin system RelE/ParE family toxin n=1 Tax=Sphingomonas sp. ERG5 TaxID=1381597 RepID=UPI000690057E|nr:type II toxin-antitoxin system RelE/ParE family toxin [Sphingomonas sp. ERG5]